MSKKQKNSNKKKADKLTNKMRAAACEYIKDWNLKRAMLAAGYSENYADRQSRNLLGNVGFRAFYEGIQNDIEKQAGITKLKLVLILVEKAENGDIEAIKELNKMMGYYSTEKKDITTGGEKISNDFYFSADDFAD